MIGRQAAVRTLQLYVSTHKPHILFISELHTSSLPKVQNICKTTGFDSLEFVPSTGRAGGLALFWKKDIDVRILVANP